MLTPGDVVSAARAPSLSRVLLLLAMLSGAFFVYAPIAQYPAIWDDHTFVFDQPYLQECGNIGSVLSPASFLGVRPVRNAARPVWLASVLLDTCLGNGRVPFYRISSMLWHAAGAFLLFALTLALSRDGPTALMAGVFFSIHPVHVESVAIITFRADLLCLVFMILAVVLHRESRRRAGRAGIVFFGAFMGASSLALLSKETAVMLPLILPVTDLLFPTGPRTIAKRRSLWAGTAACAALVVLYLVFRAPRTGYVMPHHRDLFSEVHHAVKLPFSKPLLGAERETPREKMEDPPWRRVYSDPGARIRTMSRIFGSYLRRLVWPHPLQGIYSPLVIESWLHPGVLTAGLGWLALLAGAWTLRRRLPLASYGVYWMLVTLLPVSCIVTLLNLESDRYLYIPSAGVCLAAAAILGEGLRQKKVISHGSMGAFLLITVAGSALIARRLPDFKNDEVFHRAILAADPEVPHAHLALAIECSDQERYDCVVDECRQALRTRPDYLMARLFCSDVMSARGQTSEARKLLQEAQQLAPNDPSIAVKLGRLP